MPGGGRQDGRDPGQGADGLDGPPERGPSGGPAGGRGAEVQAPRSPAHQAIATTTRSATAARPPRPRPLVEGRLGGHSSVKIHSSTAGGRRRRRRPGPTGDVPVRSASSRTHSNIEPSAPRLNQTQAHEAPAPEPDPRRRKSPPAASLVWPDGDSTSTPPCGHGGRRPRHLARDRERVVVVVVVGAAAIVAVVVVAHVAVVRARWKGVSPRSRPWSASGATSSSFDAGEPMMMERSSQCKVARAKQEAAMPRVKNLRASSGGGATRSKAPPAARLVTAGFLQCYVCGCSLSFLWLSDPQRGTPHRSVCGVVLRFGFFAPQTSRLS